MKFFISVKVPSMPLGMRSISFAWPTLKTLNPIFDGFQA